MSGLVLLALGTIAFVGTHLAMSHPLRMRLVGQLGEAGFSLLYSLVAFATLGWMIWAYQSADAWPLWTAPDPAWTAASLIMLVASILLIGSLIRNPAFPHPGAAKLAKAPARGVYAITRHPMNWSFILWALTHIAVYGSLRNLIVAAGILVLAVAGSIGQDRKKRALLTDWSQWQARTSFIPFGALLSGRAKWRDALPSWIAIVGGFVLWLAVTSLHAPQVSLPGWLGLI
ncbi:MAG TPA: NnrU family protein [Allosphingosinicella sp.]|uniref:NnrU family protein n=1 Tax=Allosphingosinicella sp. TaxID=2823234 RepID=UPI002F2746B8